MPAGNLELKAKWEVKQYTLTWVVDGQETKVTYNFGEEITPLVAPEKTGYTFTGWDKEIPTTMPAEDVTITATWTINKYTITFNTEGGSEVASITQDYGTAITAPEAPTKEGYTFVGWEPVLPATMPAHDLVVTAQWTINKYTVTFVDHDGTELSTQTVEHGSSAITPSDPAREGYTFVGWDVGFDNVTGNLTVTAQYEIKTYTVSFDVGEGSTVEPQTLNHGETATEPSAPEREGYTFVGWYEDEALTTEFDFGTEITADTTIYAKWDVNTYTLTYTAGENGSITGEATQTVEHGNDGTAVTAVANDGYHFVSWSDNSTANPRTDANVTEDITVEASFAINEYTVTFVDHDGTELSTQTVEHGSSAITPSDPAREGYTFVGWDVGFDNVTGNLTVTAQYEIKTYTVSFDVGEGSTVEPQTLNHGETATEPSAPEREGYTFVGWYEDEALTTEFDFGTEITADTTIYAKWDVNTYTLTYTAGENGSITGEATQTVEHGNDGTAVTAVANDGYHFVSWSDNSTANPRTDANVTEDITVEASFAINEYTVTFVDHDGTELSTQTVEHGSSAITPSDPAREGYTFVGWDVGFDNVTGNLTVTAQYEIKTYTVSFDVGEGSTVEPQTLNHGETATEPSAPEREGYTFVGWYEDEALTTEFDFGTEITADTTIYAKWDVNTYTLTYTAGENGSITGEATQTVEHGNDGTAVTAVANDGYHFVSWSDNSTANPRTDANVTEDITVEASFAINEYTVTFVDHDGTELSTQTVEHGSSAITPSDPAREGYTFVGWDVGFDNVTGNLTVTAQYEIKTYTVSFDVGEGSTVEPQTLNHGETATEPSAPEREGYTFVGWYEDEALTTEFDFGTEITADTTIYAKWDVNTYTLTYTAGENGSITGEATQTVEHGNDGTAVTAVANDGYHFVSWSDNSTANPRTDANVTEDITVEASFAINEYTVTFVDHDGTELSTQTVEHGSSAITPSDPAREGYTFVGWDVGFDNVTGNLTVTAQYEIKTYTVSFDVGEGSTVEPQTLNHGETATEPSAPEREGYTFVGWYEDEALTTEFDFGTEITADTTIYAKWDVNTYTLTYTAGENGSITGEATQTVEHGNNGTAVTAVANDGYHFVSWSDNSTANPRTDANVTEDITVEASFAINEYTVTFVDHDGTELSTQTVEHGSSAITPSDPAREGYTFVGWYEDEALTTEFDFGTEITADTTIYAKWDVNTYTLTYTAGENGSITGEATQTVEHGNNGTAVTAVANDGYHFVSWSDNSTANPRTDANVTEDITVEASFAINEYTVTFVDHDGTELSTQTVEHGSSAITPSDPAREGYTFVGWDVGFDNVTGNLTVTAQYEIKTYTVSFDVGEGSTVEPQTLNHGETATEPSAPEREGYTFVGWYEDEALTTEFDFGTEITADTTIYAKWDVNTYTLTYTAGENGSITGEATQTVEHGNNGTAVTAVANDGYHFVSWSDNSTANPRTDANVTEDITVEASFAINEYTVTFVDHDGTELSTQTVEHGSSAITPSDPAREGYTFVGWDVGFDNVTGNLTVTAQYEIKTYTVSFDVGEGSTVEPQTLNHGETATEPSAPEREGYTFVGWYEDEALTTEFDFGTEITADTTIYAKWDVNTYTLTYTAGENGSITGEATQTVEHGNNGTAVTAVANDGYHFVSWSDNSTANPRTDANVTEDITVEASFAINEYTVTFVDHDGTELSTQTVEHGSSAITPSDPAREGYTFVGWYEDEALTTEFDFDTEITADTTIYAKWEINIYTVSFDVTPEDATVVVIDSEDIEVTAEEDGSYKLKPGDYTYIVDAEGYIAKEASFTVDATDQSITVDLETVIVIGDETVGELNIVNRDYIDNSVISDDIGPVTINIGNEDVTDSFSFTFYDQEEGNEITNFDLSEGATTFRVFMEATSEEYKNISTYVVFKYRSVTIGDNDEYYTIEDALAEADSGDMVYVKYNTSFANTDIAEEVYDSTDFTVKSGVTLLLPYSSDLSSSTNDTPSGTSGALSRDKAYVQLTIPTGIDLNIDGTLTINAMRANISTRFSGHVTGTNYAQLHLKEDSKITVKDGGTLNSIGFVYGDGILEALSGSNIYESMFVKSFRGGSATLNVFRDVFPFDQYTVNNIEVDMIIYSDANYIAKALLWADSTYYHTDIQLIGNGTGYLLGLTKGCILRSYDSTNGRVTYEIQGQASVNDVSVSLKVTFTSITASSKDKNLPLDGTWSINVASGSELTINSWVMLLPGANVNIEPEAKVTVSEKGKITVFDPYEYLEDNEYNVYPIANAENYYRVKPAFDFNGKKSATLNVDGKLVVEGSLAGRVHRGETGSIDLLESAVTTYEVKYVSGSAGSAEVYSRDVKYIEVGESPTIHTSRNSADSGTEIAVVATVTDADGNPLEGKEVEFSGGAGNWSATTGTTDSKGKVRVTYTIGDNDSGSITLSVEELDNNKTDSVAIKIESTGGGTCIADGTLITLADGSQKPVEELTGDELLLVWNLETGSFDIAPIAVNFAESFSDYEIIHLHFSDGTDVKIIDEHAFWDFDLNRYAFINKDNAQEYLGHWFKKQITDADGNLTWTKVELIDVDIEHEYTRAWTPITYEHLSFYANGMLSMTGEIEGIVNTFEICPDTMKIDQNAYLADIAEYGLFTYEEFAQLINVPEEMFDAFQAKHLKVAIGKGHITLEDILALIMQYGEWVGLE